MCVRHCEESRENGDGDINILLIIYEINKYIQLILRQAKDIIFC